MIYSKKKKLHNHNKTYRHKGGVNKLKELSADDEAKARQNAIDLIKELLLAKRAGKDAVRITDIKETAREKKTGTKSNTAQVYINDKKLDRRALCYILAELTGIDKFRIDNTTTTGEYKGHIIFGKQMNHNYQMMEGVDYTDSKGKFTRLLGIREFIELYKDEYYAKYLSNDVGEPVEEKPKPLADILDSAPMHIPTAKEGAIGLMDEQPFVVKTDTPTLLESIINTFSPSTPEPVPEPFADEEPKRCPTGEHINHSTGQCEPVVRKIKARIKKPAEPTIEMSISKPIGEQPFSIAEDKNLSKPIVDVPDIPKKEDVAQDVKPPVYQTENRNMLLEKEREEFENNRTNTDFAYLYPHLNDPNFNIKIARRKEFNDTKFDGTIYDVRKQADIMCEAEFELMPHQLFVKNFLSFQTPYNSLLLYHSLGTGKTCSAIGVAEEMRAYLKQVGVTQKIMIVASPNVQVNFRTQLFNDRKLEEIDGLWNLDTCVGHLLLREINPTNLKGLSRERVISEINGIIKTYYVFMGYGELANYISKVTNITEEAGFTMKEKKAIEIKKIKKNFNNRLIIIDEVHNIRITDENKEKRTAELLMTVAKHSDNMRLLLLSATPMYNSYKEIVWLLNLINANDKRATVSVNDIFDKEGNFKEEKKLEDGRIIEGGRDILVRKLTGYVSYVRGENPYTFPIRIYPDLFAPENLISKLPYPKTQMNNKPIETPIQSTPVFTTAIGEYQHFGYEFIMNYLLSKSFNKTNAYGVEINMPSFENMESFGYTLLLVPLEALNIVYPTAKMDALIEKRKTAEQAAIEAQQPYVQEDVPTEEGKSIIDDMIGKRGLAHIVNYKTSEGPPLRYDFEYRPKVVETYGRVFAPDQIGKYSSKIAKICECIANSKGIVLVYSQYIDGGAVPIALALEEMGFGRFGSAQHTRNLFKSPPVEPIDALTMLPQSQSERGAFKQAKYVMITGDKYFSPNNGEDMKSITSPENYDGSQVKVILISKAASEGLDFKCIRQVHILEPWYNMNRIEQIVGRGVRNLSHCGLPYEERNVEIYLHGTLPQNDIEPADLYVYRLAEKKTKQIGQVTRLLKETAVDCLLNIGQTNFTVEKFLEIAENKDLKINLASKKTIDYQIGDKPFTNVCDYMDNCAFTCSPTAEINPETDIIKDTYGEDFVKTNYEMILKRIREMFREQSVYKWPQIENYVNAIKTYPKEQIFYTLTQLIDDKNEYLLDKYGRRGYLINKEDYYAFQPIEVNDEGASAFERSAPVDYKHESVIIKMPEVATMAQGKDTEPDDESERALSYDEILMDIRAHVKSAIEPTGDLDKGESDWYLHANKVMDTLVNIHKIPLADITKHIYYHYLDSMRFVNKLTLVINMYAPGFAAKNENETLIKRYFDAKIIEARTVRGIVLADESVCKIYVQSAENPMLWEEAKQSDKKKLGQTIIEKYIVPAADYKDKVIGFMHLFARNKQVVFKIKDTTVERNTGAKFENETKGDIIKTLNKVLNQKAYTARNSEKMAKIGLCVIGEILIRDITAKTGENIFFDTEKAILNNVAF